jgi:hypothetical protein
MAAKGTPVLRAMEAAWVGDGETPPAEVRNVLGVVRGHEEVALEMKMGGSWVAAWGS